MRFREATAKDIQNIKTLSVVEKIQRDEGRDFIFALEDEGELLGIGGFRLIVPTTAWVWVDVTEAAEGHWLTSFRLLKDMIQDFSGRMGIKRLQAFVRPEEKYIRLVRHLGFEQESVMKNFYGEEDGLLYARIL